MSGTFSENRIFLIGLSGSGKSTVGPLLASILHFTFCDTDSLIEKTSGQSIVEIFKDVGELTFRKHENIAMREAAEKDNIVIACGGGAPTFLANQEILKTGKVIWLDITPEEAANRLSKSLAEEPRPLLGFDPKSRLESLYTKRVGFYSESDLRIQVDKLTPEQVCGKINTELHRVMS